MLNDRCRPVSPVAVPPGEGLLTERTAGVQPVRRERVFMPQTGHPATRGASGKPVLKGSTISAFETCYPIDTAPPVGEKMLLPVTDVPASNAARNNSSSDRQKPWHVLAAAQMGQ